MPIFRSRTLLMAAAIAATAAVWSSSVIAQPGPLCDRLEASLDRLNQLGDRTSGGRGRGYEQAIARQQVELDRTTAHARRIGCDGFFLFGGKPPECDGLNIQINKMKANLDRMNREYSGMGGGSSEIDAKRRQLLAALADGNCGPQYRPQQAARPRSLLEQLFGVGPAVDETDPNAVPNDMPPMMGGNYRTVCVRSCDGGFFPISFAVGRGRFSADEKSCQALCPAQQVELYVYHNPGQNIEDAVSIDGRPYSALPNALKFRQEYNPACSCKRPDQTWAEALSHIQDQGERGDIIVTDEQSKQLSQPASKLADELKKAPKGTKKKRRETVVIPTDPQTTNSLRRNRAPGDDLRRLAFPDGR